MLNLAIERNFDPYFRTIPPLAYLRAKGWLSYFRTNGWLVVKGNEMDPTVPQNLKMLEIYMYEGDEVENRHYVF